MTKDYSPFTPGFPIPVEFFIGRAEEVNRLRKKVANATLRHNKSKRRLQVAFLSGERGIGKSSLASFARHLSERDYKVIGIHSFLGGVVSIEEMVRRIFDRLIKESLDKNWHEKITEFFGNRIKQVGLFGITLEFNAAENDLKYIASNFAHTLRKLTEKLEDERQGLFIILDDINGLAGSYDFANWLKSFLDEIATSREQLPLCLLMVGLEERRQSLISLQPSLARVFDLIEIKGWSEDETRSFFENAFSEVGITLEDNALKLLVRFSGGLPVLAHEIGDAVLTVDRDNKIDKNDALEGIINAAEIVGRKHIESVVFNAIRSRHYTKILKKTLELDYQFQRVKVIEKLNDSEKKVFDNFLRRMKDLGVIVRCKEKGPGVYRFSNQLHYLYFMIEEQLKKQSGL